MSRHRTSPSSLLAAAVDAAVAALDAVDLDLDADPEDPPSGAGVRLLVDGHELLVRILPVAYCTGQRALQLIADRGPNGVTLVVADKITTEAQQLLTDGGCSWLDRRGRLHLRAPGVRIDTDVPNQLSTAQPTGERPIRGRGGVTVAYWLCEHPERSLSPNRASAELGLAPSTISTAVRRLINAGVANDDGTGIFPELFWELAATWNPDQRWLAAAPDPGVARTADRAAPAWKRSGTPAAIAYGAAIPTAGGEPIVLYVPGPVDLSIAVRRFGSAQPGSGAAIVKVAPTRAVTAGIRANAPAPPDLDGWPAAPVLAVALDLAHDRTRGHQLLTDWNHPDAVWR
ncbi:MAG: hypothetical protein Q7V57_01030 [Actinomycetota bacterium]|nr:hypothetical protein [Actinomycetota bacterium]